MVDVYFSKELKDIISKIPQFDDEVAVKVHFGENGNTRFVSSDSVKAITKYLNQSFFLTDTNTLYTGMRSNARDHETIAREHGFDFAEIRIADGMDGSEYRDVEINKKTFDKVKIGKAIADSKSMLVISHIKGHGLFGYGGSIKNLGMGCGSRAGKLQMHSKIHPNVDKIRCTGCGRCIEHCQSQAITIEQGKAVIHDQCTGCARCISVCPNQAIKIPWQGATSKEAMQRCAEYAYGATKDKKCFYINFINNVTEQCDCAPDSRIIGRDIGIMASTDPVALDQASLDQLKEVHGYDIFQKIHNIDGSYILEYAEKIGLGKRSYNLILL